MNLQDLEKKYIGSRVSERKVAQQYTYMGRFGKSVVHQLSFLNHTSRITADVCIEEGKIAGIVPDKELNADEWGVIDDTEEITEEEFAVIARYLDAVLMTPAEEESLAREAAAMLNFGISSMDFEDDDEEDESQS